MWNVSKETGELRRERSFSYADSSFHRLSEAEGWAHPQSRELWHVFVFSSEWELQGGSFMGFKVVEPVF